MVRVSDWYSKGLGFESQLDPIFFSVDLFLTLSARKITCGLYSYCVTFQCRQGCCINSFHQAFKYPHAITV